MSHSYQSFPMNLAKNIRMLVLDVDGVLTAGQIFLTDECEQIKAFNVRDGHGIKLLQRMGIEVAILTGRTSKVVEHRTQELGIKHLIQGSLRKADGIAVLCEKAGIQASDCAYMGDDVIDLPAMDVCRFSMAPADAHQGVQSKVDWVSSYTGGNGAVRQACEGLIIANNAWDEIMQTPYGVSAQESGW
ncbi:MAG: HAD-IIIA family hydrolase [Mariprofundaceae bacterium]|nr:HAD-IIIA family hydrolase [Mariprofundaceae bacterium]